MPAFSGKFQYLDERGGALAQGPCQLTFDAETCTVTPGSATPIAFDLGDVDIATPGEWDFQLQLFTGRRVTLQQFGPAFGQMSQQLLSAWRDRTVRCLMLEDLEQMAAYSGAVNGGAAEIRLYGSNLAVLPLAAKPTQWRLAEVDSAVFDDASYSMRLTSGTETLTISKLAKKTDEFRQKLQEALDALHTRAAQALHQTFPFLDPDQLQKLLTTMPEGRNARLTALAAIHPKLADALIATAVDAPLKPYFDALRKRAAGDGVMAGYKFIRPDEDPQAAGNTAADDASADSTAEAAPPDEEESAEPSKDNKPPLFFWFFFPLANGGMAAWEATTGSGRATYFFRITGAPEAAIAQLARGLALVNFRREPVYLPDESLEREQRYHRYAIGCRKLPDLRALRASFAGRALHTSLEAWQTQVDGMK